MAQHFIDSRRDRVGKARRFPHDGRRPVVDLIRLDEVIAKPTGVTIVRVITLKTQVELAVL
jgi:hypothetical protein